jgi:hypothetical protein
MGAGGRFIEFTMANNLKISFRRDAINRVEEDTQSSGTLIDGARVIESYSTVMEKIDEKAPDAEICEITTIRY